MCRLKRLRCLKARLAVGGAPTARQEGSGDAVRMATAGVLFVNRLTGVLSLSKSGDLGQLHADLAARSYQVRQ